jgi:hypothetical protein
VIDALRYSNVSYVGLSGSKMGTVTGAAGAIVGTLSDGGSDYTAFGDGTLAGMPVIHDLVVVPKQGSIALATSRGLGTMGFGNSGGIGLVDTGGANAVAVARDPTSPTVVLVAFDTSVVSYDLSAPDIAASLKKVASGFKQVGGIAARADAIFITDTTAGVVYQLPR